MKKCHSKQTDIYSVIIYNDDENPIISQVEFSSFAYQKYTNRHISLKFINETKETKERFENLPGVGKHLNNCEAIFSSNMDDLILFLKIIQEIDPLPLDAFSEISARVDYDFSLCINQEKVKMLASKEAHQAALEEALATTCHGDNDILVFLANLYESKQDKENYLNVLEHIPQNHPHFISANKEIYAQLMLEDIPKNDEQRYCLLERKFRSALNSEQTDLAGNYFNELCGNSGLNPVIRNIKSNPDTLIQIAQEQRVLQRELQELKAYKIAQEKMKNQSDADPFDNNQTKSSTRSLGLFSIKNERDGKSINLNKARALNLSM